MDTKIKTNNTTSEKIHSSENIDEQMLERLFRQFSQEIPDDGFTDRVMKSIAAVSQEESVSQKTAFSLKAQIPLLKSLNWFTAILSVAIFLFAGGPQLVWNSVFAPIFSNVTSILPVSVFRWTFDDWLVAFFRQAHQLYSIDVLTTPLPTIYILLAVLTALAARRLALLTV
ncbi:MAG: DUF5056 domain-containing protein [Bacteroidaceae bacterium]|nr:DUF5056 domain-containing protein [Bacteroidaceae bacterium]